MKLHHLLQLTCALFFILTGCKNTKPAEIITFRHTYKFQSDIAEKLEKDTVAWKYQFAASDFATKGDYRKALEQWDVAFPGRYTPYTRQKLDSLRDRYKVIPAAD